MSPSLIEIRRLTIFSAVVLPQPDGPMSTQISPGATSKLSSETAALLAARVALDDLFERRSRLGPSAASRLGDCSEWGSETAPIALIYQTSRRDAAPVTAFSAGSRAPDGPDLAEIALDGGPLALSALVDIAWRGARLRVGEGARERMIRAAQALADHVAAGRPVYGVTTGLGARVGEPLVGDGRRRRRPCAGGRWRWGQRSRPRSSARRWRCGRPGWPAAAPARVPRWPSSSSRCSTPACTRSCPAPGRWGPPTCACWPTSGWS